MNRAFFFIAAMMIVSCDSLAQFEWNSGGSQSSSSLITVNSDGIVSAAPDVFFLEVAVIMEDINLEKIHAETAKRCGQIVTAARQFSLDRARTFTRDYTISPVRDNAQKLIAYRVAQQYRFALSDLNQAEALTMAVLRAGATTVESIQFTVANTDELWELAREKAVENAVKRATRMTKAAGAKLGPAKSISDRANQVLNPGCAWSPSDRTPTTDNGTALPDGDHVFFVPPGVVKFQVSVQVSFIIEPL